MFPKLAKQIVVVLLQQFCLPLNISLDCYTEQVRAAKILYLLKCVRCNYWSDLVRALFSCNML